MVQSRQEWLMRPGGLAERLKQLREAAGLTGDQVSQQLGWRSRSKVPKIENGQQMPSEDDLRQWTEATGAADALPELLKLREEGLVVHAQWKEHVKRGHAAVQQSFDEFVRSGTVIRNFQVTLVPGLLQTPDYARYRALESVREHGFDADKVDEAVAARMRRQEVLYASGKRFDFLILEAALRHLLCPPDVMLAQLDRLQSVIGLSNVRFGIIPFGKELRVCPLIGFLMVDDAVVPETFTGTDTIRGPEAAKWGEMLDKMWLDAVENDDARQLISDAAQALRSQQR